MGRYDTLVNAVIGTIAAIVLSFVPFSTIVGAAIAGLLEGPDTRDGAVVGSAVGLLTFLPFAFLAVFGLLFFGLAGIGFGTGTVPVGSVFGFAFFFVLFVFLLFVYSLLPALLGGVLGSLLAREYPDTHARARNVIGMEPAVGTAPSASEAPVSVTEHSVGSAGSATDAHLEESAEDAGQQDPARER